MLTRSGSGVTSARGSASRERPVFVLELGHFDGPVCGMSGKAWVVRLVGQETVSSATSVASPRPIDSTRLLPPKLPLLPIIR